VKLNFRTPLSVAIAIGVGLIVLLGFFFGTDASGEITLLGILRSYFLQGAVVVSGAALLVGVYNLTAVHVKKIRQRDESIYSVITVLALLLTLLVGIYDITMTYLQGEPGLRNTRWIFENIQMPIESSLMAIIAISLTFAAIRLLSRRLNFMSAVFSVVVLVLLIGAIPAVAASDFNIITIFRNWILSVPAVGGARGIVLGMAMGIIATGIRILMGTDRPYGG
jgi:cytochrome bd-type quinol oxidase subunit 2